MLAFCSGDRQAVRNCFLEPFLLKQLPAESITCPLAPFNEKSFSVLCLSHQQKLLRDLFLLLSKCGMLSFLSIYRIKIKKVKKSLVTKHQQNIPICFVKHIINQLGFALLKAQAFGALQQGCVFEEWSCSGPRRSPGSNSPANTCWIM